MAKRPALDIDSILRSTGLFPKKAAPTLLPEPEPKKTIEQLVLPKQGNLMDTMQRLEKSFKMTPEQRQQVRNFLYTRQVAKGKDHLSGRITGLEGLKPWEELEGFIVPEADYLQAKAALTRKDLSGLVSEHRRFVKAREAGRANIEAERQARETKGLPFTPEEYALAAANGTVVKNKDGSYTELNDAITLLSEKGIPQPGYTQSQAESAQEAQAASKLLTPRQLTEGKPGDLPVEAVKAIQVSKPGGGGSLKMDPVTEFVTSVIGDPLVQASTLIDPDSTLEERIGAAANLAVEAFGGHLITGGAKGLKKLVSSADEWAKFEGAVQKLGIPDHIKVVESMRGYMDDPKFYSYMEAASKKLDNFQGKGGFEEGAEFVGKQTEERRPTSEPVSSTGLANRVQAKEAQQGVINEVFGTKGVTPEQMHERGKLLFEQGARYDDIADDIGRGARGVNADDFAVLAFGKAEKLKEIQAIRSRMDEFRGRGLTAYQKDIDALSTKLDEAVADLDIYLRNVQAGKGEWHRIGQALQVGLDLDTGKWDDVLAELKRRGHATDAEVKATKADVTEKAKTDEWLVETNAAVNEAGDKVGPVYLRDQAERAMSGLKRYKNDLLAKERGKSAAETRRQIADVDRAMNGIQVAAQRAYKSRPQIVKDAQREWERLQRLNAADAKDGYKKWWDARMKEDSLARKQYDDWWNKSMKDAQKAFDSANRIEDAAVRKSYRQWWAAMSRNIDLMEELATGVKRPTRGRAEVPEDIANIRAEGDLMSRKAAAMTKNEDLKRQLSTGVFKPPVIRRSATDQALSDIRALNKKYDKRVRARVRDASVSVARKRLRGSIGAFRGFTLGADVGVLLRQGLFTLARPATFISSVAKAGKNAFSEKNFAKWQNEMDTMRSADGRLLEPIERQAGLSLSDAFTGNLNMGEELVAAPFFRNVGTLLAEGPARLLEKGGKYAGARAARNIGAAAGGSLERFQVTFINAARKDAFKKAVDAGFSPEELAQRARFINSATGRSNMKNAPDWMQIAMTSPRYEASRWEMLAEPLKNLNVLTKSGTGKTVGMHGATANLNRAALRNLQDMAITAGEITSMFGLMSLAGYEVDFDPRSSDFLKMRKGDEVWDVTAGLAPRLRDVLRVYIAWKGEATWGKAGRDILGSSFSRTINPGLTVPYKYSSLGVQKLGGKKEFQDPFFGLEFKENDIDWSRMFPLVVQAFRDAEKADGIGAGVSAFGREFVGTGVSRYPKKGADKKNTNAPEIRLSPEMKKLLENAQREIEKRKKS